MPAPVQTFVRPWRAEPSKPIRRALPVLVLALLLAPHRRWLKTLAGMVLGQREHAATISRRLRHARWKTRAWYTRLDERLLAATERWERRLRTARRHGMLVIDTTYHGTMSECMENLLCGNRHQHPHHRSAGNHAVLVGLRLTDQGGRLPWPRKRYDTKGYGQKKRRR